MRPCWSAFVIALLLLVSFPPLLQAQDATGTIVFRVYYCPYGYADQFYPETCAPGGSMPSVHIDGSDQPLFQEDSFVEGPVTFTLPVGRYWVGSGIPGHYTIQRPVTCVTDGETTYLPVLVRSNATVECQQLIFGDSGRATNPPDELDLNLTIRARSCDPPIARSAFHDACFGNTVTGAPFVVSAYRFDAEVTTDADGNASVDVPDFSLEIDPSGDFTGSRVWRFCSSADHPGVPLLYPLNLAYHSSPVTCDIYLVPEPYDLAPDLADAESGLIEIHYRLCPPGFLDTTYYATCHDIAIPDAAIELTSESGDITAIGYTDSTGNVSYRVPPGSWTLPPDILGQPGDTYAVFCTDANDPGSTLVEPLTITHGDHVICDLYLIPTLVDATEPAIVFTAIRCAGDSCVPARLFQVYVGYGESDRILTLDELGFASIVLSGFPHGVSVIFQPFWRNQESVASITCRNDVGEAPVRPLDVASAYQSYAVDLEPGTVTTCSIRISV